jgi:DNA-binding transcriptional MerR regulator
VGLTSPSRTKGGYRTYSSQQVERLQVIQNLRFKDGLNINAIRQFLDKSEPPAAARVTPKESQVSIGRRLRQLRRSRKLTLSQAAAATTVSAGFSSCLERGEVHASISTLQKLAAFYKYGWMKWSITVFG